MLTPCLAHGWIRSSYNNNNNNNNNIITINCLFSFGTVFKGYLQSRKNSVVCHRTLEILLENPSFQKRGV